MPSLSEAFRGHPVYLHQKHHDFNSLQELPDSYSWTQPHDHHLPNYPSNNKTKIFVPVIDLNHPNAPNLIGHACKTWGVFQVVNHDIPMSLFSDIQRASLALFSLPLHQKLKAARSPDGVSGYGRARISSFFPKLMWSECFTILDSPLDLFLKLWPQDYAKYWYVRVSFIGKTILFESGEILNKPSLDTFGNLNTNIYSNMLNSWILFLLFCFSSSSSNSGFEKK